MSIVVDCLDFLDCLGASATLREAEPVELADSLVRANIPPVLWGAIFAGDPQALTSILGAKSAVCCLIAPAKEDEEEEKDDTPDEQEEEEDEDAPARNFASASIARTR